MLITCWEDKEKRMGPDRCAGSATAVTKKKAKRNKYDWRILS